MTMHVAVPYCAQGTRYSCGPTALRMLLAHFGIRASETELIAALNTDERNGTDHASIITELARRGLRAVHGCGACLRDVRNMLGTGTPVLVNYLDPSTNNGHYALVVGMTSSHVTLHDPWNGANFVLDQATFLCRWRDHDGSHRRWMLVAQRTLCACTQSAPGYAQVY